MSTRERHLAIPELFLGLLSLALAIVLTAKIVSGTIHDARHIHDTISVPTLVAARWTTSSLRVLISKASETR